MRRRARVRLARWRRAGLSTWDRSPRARLAAASGLALLVNLSLVTVLSRMPMRLPPEGAPSAPIEVVRLPEPPAPPQPPEPAVVEPDPKPEPEPEAAPETELPTSRGTSGVVALDCNGTFDERERQVACAGGAPTLGYDLDREAWSEIGERLTGYGPTEPGPPSAFGRAGDPSMTVDPDRLRAFRGRGAGRRGYSEGVEAEAGAQAVIGDEAEYLDPPSILTSHEERKRIGDALEGRRDARFRRDAVRDLEEE